MQARDGGDIPDLLGGRDIKNTLIIYIKKNQNVKLKINYSKFLFVKFFGKPGIRYRVRLL